MKAQPIILALKRDYFAELHQALLACPFVYVRKSGAPSIRHFYPVFHRAGAPVEVPAVAGVYLVYRAAEERPFYGGESGNLYQRIEYHFSDDPDAIAGSTLKKHLSAGRRSLAAMAEDLRFRFVAVPFGRNDFEEFLHAEYQINARKPKAPRPAPARFAPG